MRNLTQLVGAGRWLHLRARGHKLVHVLVAATALSIVVDATAVAAPLPQLPKSLIIKPIATTDAPGIPEAGDATARLAKEQPAAGGITTFGDASGAFRCSPTWNYIAAKANSFVTGNCYGATSGAWYMQRTKKQFDSTHQIYWDGGYVNGSYDGCGWMRQQDSTLSNTAVNTVCASPDKAYCDYIVCVDGKPWTFGGTSDGQPTNVKQACWEYANYRPWLANSQPLNALVRYVQPNETWQGSYRLWARYVAKYPWYYNGTAIYFVMVHDTRMDGTGQGNWVFVPLTCF
jgi:hypothetical protein